MTNITDIIRAYTEGKTTLEDANAKLKELDAPLHLDPARNTITEAERTTHGLLDTGTGSLDKVRVTDGHLDHAVNEVSSLAPSICPPGCIWTASSTRSRARPWRSADMDISSLGITGVAAITVICLLIGQGVKASGVDNK